MNRILRYFFMRILMMIPMVFILLTLVFFVLRVMPGDPVSAVLGGHAPEKVIEERKHLLGLDKPIVVQYFEYLGQLLRLDFGQSMNPPYDSVARPILDKLPATMELTLVGLGLALLIGIPLGAWASRKRRSPLDYGVRLYANLVYCIPVFWMGLMLQLIFGIWLNVLPVAGRVGSRVSTSEFAQTGLFLIDTLTHGNIRAFGDVVQHLILPGFTLGITLSGVFVRITRANMLDTLSSDFVLAARARGLPAGLVARKHALRNSFIPVLTMMGLQFSILLAGAILTESTFSWPGIGRLLLERISLRDYPVIQGIIVMYAMAVSLVSLIVDLIYAAIDPRVNY